MFDGTSATIAEFPIRERIVPRTAPIGTAIVGYGYWGPNLARNVDLLAGARLAWCCDADAERRARLEPSFRATRFSDSLDELLADDGLDGVLLATPVPTHAELATADDLGQPADARVVLEQVADHQQAIG